jgi:hypothetical protein
LLENEEMGVDGAMPICVRAKSRVSRQQKQMSEQAREAFGDSAWLVAKKYLAEKDRENKVAIKHAIESLLSSWAKAAAL